MRRQENENRGSSSDAKLFRSAKCRALRRSDSLYPTRGTKGILFPESSAFAAFWNNTASAGRRLGGIKRSLII